MPVGDAEPGAVGALVAVVENVLRVVEETLAMHERIPARKRLKCMFSGIERVELRMWVYVETSSACRDI